MHPLVAEIIARVDDNAFAHSLLRRLEHNPVHAEHPIIVDNLHRFTGCRAAAVRTIVRYLGQHSRNRHRAGVCWRAFRALVRMEARHLHAAACALLSRRHPSRRVRLAAREYLAFAGTPVLPER